MVSEDPIKPNAKAGKVPDMRIFAFDHRMQFQEMPGADEGKIGAFKLLCLRAAQRVAGGRPGYGILCDHRLGRDALDAASGGGLWIGRPVEWPGSRPLTLEPDVGAAFGGLEEWPPGHVVKVLCFYHPSDDTALKEAQEKVIFDLFRAARRCGLKFLLEVIPSRMAVVDETTTPTIIQRFYDLGVYPDWWKLEPFDTASAWSAVCETITANDPNVCGIVVLGLDAPHEHLKASFSLAVQFELVKGFAVGRTIFGDVARAWMLGQMDDGTAVAGMEQNYRALCDIWDEARQLRKGEAP